MNSRGAHDCFSTIQDAAKSTALRDHIIYYMTACCRRSSSTPAASVHPISSRWEEAGCTWQQIDGRPCKLSAHGKLVVTLEFDDGDDGDVMVVVMMMMVMKYDW